MRLGGVVASDGWESDRQFVEIRALAPKQTGAWLLHAIDRVLVTRPVSESNLGNDTMDRDNWPPSHIRARALDEMC